jgi:hypothetical protein
MALNRKLALETLDCSFDFSSISALTPAISDVDLDAATGTSGKLEARRLLEEGERLLENEQRNQRMHSWWKFLA